MREQTNDRNWSEMSYSRFNSNGRENWYESEEYERKQGYGLLEDITLYNCYGVEDIWNMIEEYN